MFAENGVSNQNTEPPLHRAVQKGQSAIVKMLLENKTDVEFKMKGGLTALHMAAKRGHFEIIESLLKFNADINCFDDYNKTPLHLAIEGGHHKVSKLLLEQKANLEIVTAEGRSPLHLAALRGHEGIVELLLASGGNIECRDVNQKTPLLCAIEGRHCNVVKKLLEEGASVSCTGSYGLSPLHIAALRGHTSIVDVILKFGASIEVKDELNRTALHLAVVEGHCGVVRKLLESGSVKYETPEGSTLVHIACQKGYQDILEQFLKFRADIDCRDSLGRTPLYVAVEEGKLHIVKVLLKLGANTELKSKIGMTPLHVAVKVSPAIVEQLLQFEANIDSRNDSGRTPLHMACIFNEKEVVATLLKLGADVNLMCKNERVPYDYIDCRYVDYNEKILKRRLSVGPDSITEMLKQHFIKLKVAGIPLRKKNEDVCKSIGSPSSLSNLWNFCEKEIEAMKTLLIDGISCYEIIRQLKNPKYVANQSAMEILECVDLTYQFPLYSDILKTLVRKAKMRYYWLNLAKTWFPLLTYVNDNSLPVLPEEVIILILSFLAEEDLKNLSKCGEEISVQY